MVRSIITNYVPPRPAIAFLGRRWLCCNGLASWKRLIIDMAVFDSLRFLSTYIKEAHLSGKQHCADLYEIVQYAGNIVPRMYLMITVGRYISNTPTHTPSIAWVLILVFI